jgi:hypothetical protein
LSPKAANNAWPVIVILMTDNGDSRTDVDVDRFNAFVIDLTARGASAHAVIVRGQRFGIISELAQNVVANLGGSIESLAISSAVPNYMKTIASRVTNDFKAMAGRYEVEFQSDPKAMDSGVEVQVTREGVRLQVTGKRP